MKHLTGRFTAECKAKDREHAIRQFKKFADIIEIYWETLTLDRKGYQRRF